MAVTTPENLEAMIQEKIAKQRTESAVDEKWLTWPVGAPSSGYPDKKEIAALALSLKASHYVDVRIRHDGKYWYVNGDWIKYLDQLFWGCKECRGDCKGHDEDDELNEQDCGNLLAVMHRDGGQYINKHGWKKACKDAELVRHGMVEVVQRAAHMECQYPSPLVGCPKPLGPGSCISCHAKSIVA